MLERMLAINEIEGYQRYKYPSGVVDYAGFEVKTTKGSYKVLIEEGQQCCENWGYLDTNDNAKDFIDANLLSVELVDMSLDVNALGKEGVTEEECIFVNFNTDKGTFQLAVYNSHNGYYGHDILILKEEIIKDYWI